MNDESIPSQWGKTYTGRLGAFFLQWPSRSPGLSFKILERNYGSRTHESHMDGDALSLSFSCLHPKRKDMSFSNDCRCYNVHFQIRGSLQSIFQIYSSN